MPDETRVSADELLAAVRETHGPVLEQLPDGTWRRRALPILSLDETLKRAHAILARAKPVER